MDPIGTRTGASNHLARAAWLVALGVLVGVRVWNAIDGPLMVGWDDFGHIGYVLFLDLYGSVPWADQGWSYFHPPLHYLFGWALAQFGSAEVLLRGLALIGGASSLAIAWLTARVTRLVYPDRWVLPWLAFVSVGSLPVYLYTATMAGNELTAAALGTLGFAILLANEARAEPRIRHDLAAGLVFGLALLAKVSAVMTLGAAGLALSLRFLLALRERDSSSLRLTILRAIAIVGVACVVSSPFYLRNWSEFGTPFRMSRTNPQVAELEGRQPPGERSWVDLAYIPAAIFSDPHPNAVHMLHSIWGTAYGQMWSDPRGRLKFVFRVAKKEQWNRASRIGVAMGLVPTFLVLLGGGLAARDLWRGRRPQLYGPLFCLSALTLGGFAWFAFDAPQHSALKASYLLGLTIPYGVFMARSFEAMQSPVMRRAAMSIVVGTAAVAVAIGTNGLVLPPLTDGVSLPLVHTGLGEHDRARGLLKKRIARTYSRNLGDLAMLGGRPADAHRLYLAGGSTKPTKPDVWNAMGAAKAMLGQPRWAIANFDTAIAGGLKEVALVNRGVVHAMTGNLEQAERDLRRALEIDPRLIPAWHNLAEVLLRVDQLIEAEQARTTASGLVGTPPRNYTYGVPNGLGYGPSTVIGTRWMLWLDGEEVRLGRAPFRPSDVVSRQPQSVGASSAASEFPHIVLVVVDTLRADHVGAYGYPRPTTPNIDRLARQGVRFANASAISSWTLPSVASLFTSLYPWEHGATAWSKKIRRRLPTLPGLLSRAGYRTIGVSGNFVHITRKGGFSRGFDVFRELELEVSGDDADPLFATPRRGRKVRARAPVASEVNEALFELVPPSADGPLFVYAHYMEPHSGYDPPTRHLERFVTDPGAHRNAEPATSAYLNRLAGGEVSVGSKERQRLVDLYDAEIASVDEAIGELLSELESRGYKEDLVVCVVADHGEEFLDHGGWFHGMNLFGESLSVPWVIRDSRSTTEGIVIDSAVDLIDVTPTLLSIAGLEPSAGMRGRAMLSKAPPPRDIRAWLDPEPRFEAALAPRLARRSLTRWPWKLIADLDGAVVVYRLDLDPAEQRPMAIEESELPRELRDMAEVLARDALEPASGPGQKAIGVDDRARLRALGYAD